MSSHVHNDALRPAALSAGDDAGADLSAPGYIVHRPGGLQAWFQGSGVDVCDVIALTPSSLWLEPRGAGAGAAGLELREGGKLWVGDGDQRMGPIDVYVGDSPAPSSLRCRHPEHARLTTVRSGLEAHRELANLIDTLQARGVVGAGPAASNWTGRERVVDTAEVLELLEFFVQERLEVSLSMGRTRATARLIAVDADAGRMYWSGTNVEGAHPLEAEVAAPHAAYEWPVLDLSRGSSSIPGWISRTTRRLQRRCPAPAGTRIRIRHPQWQSQIVIERPVQDLSQTGLCFEGDLPSDLLYPGLILPNLELLTADGERATLRGEVRSCTPATGSVGGRVGLRIWPIGADAQALTKRLIGASMYPHTRSNGVDGWDIFTQSGYLNLSGKTPEDFSAIQNDYLDATRKLERAPDVAQLAYWPSEGAPAATVSHLRVYSSCWLICQVSKVKQAAADSRRGMREVYQRVYELAQMEPETRWLLTYVQDVAPTWSRRVHRELPARFESTGDGYVLPFRALECSVAKDAHPFSGAGWDVRQVAGDDALRVMRELCRVRPAQYLDALDLTESTFDLKQIRTRWGQAELVRERCLLVAYDGDRPLATAVVEIAEKGVHLFGLLDSVRLYPLANSGERAFEALVAAARDWFSEHGRRRFVILSEYEQGLQWQRLGLRDLGTAVLTLLSVHRMPELLQEVCNLSSSRPPPPAVVSEPPATGSPYAALRVTATETAERPKEA